MIFKKPLITEKALSHQTVGKYSFVVDRQASKDQVAVEFQKLFGIKPLSVNTYILKGKLKTNWKTKKSAFKSNIKKAVITIKKDQKIDILTLKNEK